MIKVKNLVCNPIFNVQNVIRYSGIHMVEPENLSHHLYETTVLALMMHKELEKLGVEVDKGILLERAVIHDISESMTNDFPRPVKYADMRIKEALDELELKVNKHIENLVDIPGLLDQAEICKDDTREGHLIKLVDLVLVARKCLREVELKGNKEFVVVTLEVRDYMWSLYCKYNDVASVEDNVRNLGSEFLEYMVATLAETINAMDESIRNNKVCEAFMLKRKGIFE